jgi:homoserine dehydrogenase
MSHTTITEIDPKTPDVSRHAAPPEPALGGAAAESASEPAAASESWRHANLGAASLSHAPITVLKFGSSVLPDEDHLTTAVHEIYRWVRLGHRVVAVVSALGGTTDQLIEHAGGYSSTPDAVSLAALLATGEARAVALLGLALDRAGIRSTVLDAGAVGLRTRGPILDARAEELDAATIRRALDDRPVVVIPGFIGRDESGRTTLLGRGGSDLTALFIARKLNADQVRLLKDVDGLYDRDPASARGAQARKFATATWEDVLSLEEGIVQHKAVRFARDHGLSFVVAQAGSLEGTSVGPGPSRFDRSLETDHAPLRIGLLGLGTVGRGVFALASKHPDLLRVVGILVTDPEKHAARSGETGVPPGLLTADPRRVLETPADVIIEAIGGIDPATEFIEAALGSGRHVVTANKAVIAAHGDRLQELARRRGVKLLYSAAVGGAVPIIETISRLAERATIESVEAVLNGTTNFILDRLGDGVAFDDAVRIARSLGFAEADPTADLDGLDAANKLVILAREAFAERLALDRINITGIRGVLRDEIVATRKAGGAVRLVARLVSSGRYLHASISPRHLAPDHPLASVKDEENKAVIRLGSGRVEEVHGKGAGRWPTSEAVLADLFDLVRLCRPSGAVSRVSDIEVVA